MRASLLNKQLTIQFKSVVRSALGSVTVTWTDVDTVWGKVDVIRQSPGSDFFATVQQQSEATHKITIRFRTDLTPNHRFRISGKRGTRSFDILVAGDPNEQNRWLQILAKEFLT